MILVDLNQVMISNLMMQIGMRKDEIVLEEGMIRHMVLNSIRSYRKKFSEEFGELVICCDDKNYWHQVENYITLIRASEDFGKVLKQE